LTVRRGSADVRGTDMILVGGANVYPAEVEAAIDEHPLVQSSCAIGIRDDDLGNRAQAIVQTPPGLTEAMLSAHLAERLVAYSGRGPSSSSTSRCGTTPARCAALSSRKNASPR
jgi:acyl-CoA synthetase (AMP-forming)/AMP-acid ligase II